MNKRVIEVLRENRIDCLPNERFSLDVNMFPENVEDSTFPATALFEKPKLREGKRKVEDHGGSFFRYFLDGSQRSWRVIDASIRGHYLPFCAGQVGVAVIKRDDNGMFSPVRSFTTVRNVLTVPNLIGKGEISDIAGKINAGLAENQHFTIVQYNYTSKEDKDPGDLGRAMIIDEMQREELRTIRKMIERNLIGDRAMLAKDGGLQYRKDKRDQELDPLKDDVIQLRNVIGLAKTFKPELIVGKGRKRQSLGNLTKGLQWKERTTVIKPFPVGNQKAEYGWWYLRLRPTDWMYSPLQGSHKDRGLCHGRGKGRRDFPGAGRYTFFLCTGREERYALQGRCEMGNAHLPHLSYRNVSARLLLEPHPVQIVDFLKKRISTCPILRLKSSAR
uniref:Uncharacterized protein n=1 Tax=Candidatus Kentrum sp. SD TaxID=2126332 RepID=A0A450YCQ2_9GAMM|nr:MAG: hypothetical protein BECKSD772F_GA0070984_103619 [Candidatus Kentron sp. SD]VFK44046.1 MAG: hypothetical protein BECKSD772E_GA0070983_103221 [Candidatus Kentron sp. SD]